MMTQHGDDALKSSAARDFRQARQQAAMQELTARLTGRSAALLSFEDVRQKLKIKEGSERRLQEIPLDDIVGSVGRYADFTRTFLPRRDRDESRWLRVKNAKIKSGGLPPIEAYQVGQVYFVVDGNHRVSIARQLGETHIKAYVSRCETNVPLTPDIQPDALIVKAEYADFLEKTHLTDIRPDANLQVTVPGQYWELETYIEAHHFLLNQQHQRQLSQAEAVGDWYDNIYLPVAQDVRERGILRDFPGRTEADLALWIFKHQAALEKELGWQINPDAATSDLVKKRSSRPRRVAARVEEKLNQALTRGQLEGGPPTGQWRLDRLPLHNDQLFTEILVPVSGQKEGWYALDMALNVARYENSKLLGLHVVRSEVERTRKAALAVQAEFQQRCQAAGIPGKLTIEVGDLVGKICDRAGWADLIIMYPANPPGSKFLARLSSRSRNVIYRSCRPVLTVPDLSLPLRRILLAYDGSPKAQEGLFVTAYLARQWQVAVDVLTVTENDDHPPELALAQEYLEAREISASFVTKQGNVAESILTTATRQDSNLIVMGGYGVNPIREAMLGANIDLVLQKSNLPILICR